MRYHVGYGRELSEYGLSARGQFMYWPICSIALNLWMH